MTIEIAPVRPEHVPEIARICFEAFAALHDRHSTPRDFESREVAAMVIGLITGSPEFRGVVALDKGRVVGSNFLCCADPVAGVGPITVDPACQSRGVGRALMGAVLDEARERGITHVRLNQEAINTTSLSLYTSLGFAWRDSVAVMQAAPASGGDGAVRPMTPGDLTGVETLSAGAYGHTRRNEVNWALQRGFPAFVLERDGRLVAYLLPGFLGHGFAEDHADLAALVVHAGQAAPPEFHRVLVPLSQDRLFRDLLRLGCRTLKVLSYMTVGPYERPRAAWMPSILN